MAYLANLNKPKNTTFLKGYLIIPAVKQAIANGKGNNAPTKIKTPPHFWVFFKLFAIFTSRYSLTFSNLEINLPPLKEQTEIVLSVEALFSKADTIEASYQNLKQQIDSLPQAILAKAFKGELVAQLPTDGDARDLLKEIATLRASLEKEKKSKKKKKVTVK